MNTLEGKSALDSLRETTARGRKGFENNNIVDKEKAFINVEFDIETLVAINDFLKSQNIDHNYSKKTALKKDTVAALYVRQYVENYNELILMQN